MSIDYLKKEYKVGSYNLDELSIKYCCTTAEIIDTIFECEFTNGETIKVVYKTEGESELRNFANELLKKWLSD